MTQRNSRHGENSGDDGAQPRLALLLLSALTLLAGCGQRAPEKEKKPPTVGFVVAQSASAPMPIELSGRTAAFQQSEVRPQVTGVIRRRLFTEGALVRQGQPLYEIDASLYRAAANEAEANLQSALASADARQAQADRLKPLAEIEAVARQDYTDALAAAKQARAAVEQGRARLETARITLRYTTVPAPITGRIGRSLATPGALVTASQATPLAQISQLDPIYVDLPQSSGELLNLRRSLFSGGSDQSSRSVRLILEDGSIYPATGTIAFAESVVDPATGTVTVRAQFPNPQGLLLPGMFVRARFAPVIDRNIFLLPQESVMRDPSGGASIFVAGRDDKAELRKVVAPRTSGRFWVVTQGIRPGERIIVEGTALLKPGQAVRPVPARTPQRLAPPPSGRGGG